MKNRKLEQLARAQRDYHRSHPWRLTREGLYIPHCYEVRQADELSWWDDVGFILNRRRIMVWWLHPRAHYADAIEALAWQGISRPPPEGWAGDDAIKNYQAAGKSRKRIVSYTLREPSAARQRAYDEYRAQHARLSTEGIALEVLPSWNIERLAWAVGISLIAPIEVRDEAGAARLARLARRLLLRQTSLEAEFPGYRYTRGDWIAEREKTPVEDQF